MPPEEGVVPEPVAPTEVSTSAPTDEQVAQNWFDEWSAGIEQKISHLEQAITHVAQSQKVTPSDGPTPSQPSRTAPPRAPTERRSSAPPAVSQGGQPVSEASAGVTVTAEEHAPQPSHWYFKRIWGKR